jgi:sorbitol-specific phosphotransferase system component IIBC
MRRHARTPHSHAGTRGSGWTVGYTIGTGVVATVVALVSAILAYAQSIGDDALKINESLQHAKRNTAPLGALQTTIDDANAIVGGLERGRTRLGG